MKLLTILTSLTIAIFCIFPDIDLIVSEKFYILNSDGVGSFIFDNHIVSQVIYKSTRYIALLTLVFFSGLVVSKYLEKYLPKFWNRFILIIKDRIFLSQKQMIFICLVIILGPITMVYSVMKPTWERARPFNIEEFGGQKQFTPIYIIAEQGDNSFPSGHAALSFAMLALAYVVSKARKKRLFYLLLTYATIGSACRVWQGGHYLSDVTVSAIITMWVILLLNKYYLKNP